LSLARIKFVSTLKPGLSLLVRCLDVASEISDPLILAGIELIAELAPGTELSQVVVQRLLADAHLVCGLFETHPVVLEVAVIVSIVESSPLRDLLHDVAHSALLGPRVLIL